MGLHLSTSATAAVAAKTQTTCFAWLAGHHDWTAPGSDAGGVRGVELRPAHDTGRGQQDAGSGWALPNLPRPMSRTFASAIACLQGWRRLEPGSSRPPAPRVLVLLVARWLAEHPKTHWSPLLPALRNEHAAALRGSQLLPPVQERNSWNRWQMVTAHPSERARAAWQNRRVRHQCITGSGTPSVSVSRLTGSQGNSRQTTAPLPFSYTQPAQNMEEALKQLRCQ